MIICALLIHFTTLSNLPDYRRDVYINSDTNTCRIYSKRTWEVVERKDSTITITNNTILVNGFIISD